jgi:hypothetical protein
MERKSSHGDRVGRAKTGLDIQRVLAKSVLPKFLSAWLLPIVLEGSPQLSNFSSQFVNNFLDVAAMGAATSGATATTMGLGCARSLGFGTRDNLLGKLTQTLALLCIKLANIAHYVRQAML